MPIVKVTEESITLPEVVLEPVYEEREIYTWKEEFHSVFDEKQFKKDLLGNMMVKAFKNS